MSSWIRVLALLALITSVLAAPHVVVADCVGQRRACLASALIEYTDCNSGCNWWGCFYGCEWLYDLDRAGCVLEYLGCINPLT